MPMVRVGKVCNLSMLQYIKNFGPVEIDELYKKFGNGNPSIVDMEVQNLLDDTRIAKEDNKYRAL